MCREEGAGGAGPEEDGEREDRDRGAGGERTRGAGGAGLAKGTRFTCFTSTKVQTLTQRGAGGAGEAREGGQGKERAGGQGAEGDGGEPSQEAREGGEGGIRQEDACERGRGGGADTHFERAAEGAERAGSSTGGRSDRAAGDAGECGGGGQTRRGDFDRGFARQPEARARSRLGGPSAAAAAAASAPGNRAGQVRRGQAAVRGAIHPLAGGCEAGDDAHAGALILLAFFSRLFFSLIMSARRCTHDAHAGALALLVQSTSTDAAACSTSSSGT